MTSPATAATSTATTRTVGRRRPIGWSPGTSIVLGAWVVGAAIARLTGAAAVILVLTAVLVGVVFDVLAGLRAAAHPSRLVAVGPSTVTAGEPVHLALALSDRPIHSWHRFAATARDRRIVVRTPNGAPVTSVDVSSRAHTLNAPGVFSTPGVIQQLRIDVETTGPVGLVWWRRSHVVDITPIHVAPVADGDAVPVERSATGLAGPVAVGAGCHDGDIDGVRPYRPGDAIGSVHWPSSLRADELIVHDRAATSEEHWLIAVDQPDIDGGRLRRTLDDGLRLGHRVSVRDVAGDIHLIESPDDAARWSAVVCEADTASRGKSSTSTDPARARSKWRTPIHTTRPEISRVDPVARWAAGAAALTSLAMLIGTLDTPPTVLPIVTIAIIVGILVSLRVAANSGVRPRAMRVAIGMAVATALAVIVVDAADVDGLLAALRGPMPNLLMLLVVLHGFEVVDRRTLRAHQAITLVVASYAAGLRIDGALGWWLAIWGAAFTVSALTTTRRPDRAAANHDARAGSGRSPVTGIRVAAWSGAFGATTLAVLSIVPVPDGPARLGLPALSNDAPTAALPGALVGPDGTPSASGDDGGDLDRGSIGDVVGYPGFTETLDTSIRGTLGDEIVMRVRSPEPAFWRGQTFSEFDGRVWTASPVDGTPSEGPVIDVPPSIGDARGDVLATEELVQTYFVEQDLPNVVFAASRPTQVIFDGTLWTRPDGALRSDVTLTAGSAYTVVSERVQVTADALRAQGDVGALFEDVQAVGGGGEVAPFLALPASTTRRTRDLATSLRSPNGSTYDTIMAYQAWLEANTEYDLDAPVPADGVDAVDDFLFGSQRGFCEQIATSLAIMLRSQGVPARLVTGYVPGERDRVSGVWKVRGSDAHAWVEVWFPLSGWQAFDPTASVPLAGDATTGTVGGDLLGAAAASIASHRAAIAGVAALLVAAWATVGVAWRVRRRRRRGRWGVLQDRFTALGEHHRGRADHHADRPSGGLARGPAAPLTNPSLARELAGADVDAADRAGVRRVADVLDRAAFDPSWVDDDAAFAEARAVVATLERRR